MRAYAPAPIPSRAEQERAWFEAVLFKLLTNVEDCIDLQRRMDAKYPLEEPHE